MNNHMYENTCRDGLLLLLASAMSASLSGCAVLSELAQDPEFMGDMQRQVIAIQQQKSAASSGSTYRAPVYVPPAATYSNKSAYQTASVASAKQTVAPVPNCLSLSDRKLHNTCPFDVEAAWCVARTGSSCMKYDNTWTIRSGGYYSVGEGNVYWNACKGANTIANRSGMTMSCYSE